MEILAPAGSQETLQAAVRSGATAVYLGGQAFSARANAKNFDREQLKEAVAYCHARGIKVHLAVNTVLLEREIGEALDFIEYACSLPVDAVIVQDVGLFWRLRQCAPTLPLHASTQMSIHTPAGARLLEELGFERVVLARELSLKEIREIAAQTPVELEHFVHGALCMSVSGQCYFSAALGTRSGNRGSCAQPCRLPFAAQDGTGHDLSLKDFSMIGRIEELAKAGVTSCKIEGRMKRPEYVAAACSACDIAVHGQAIPEELSAGLRTVFSRSGFTTGYPDAKLGREMFGVRRKEDVTGATSAVLSGLQNLYKQERQTIPITFLLEIQAGKPIQLTVSDTEGHQVSVQGPVPEPARSRAIEESRCMEQLQKTGGTPCFLVQADCRIEEGLSVPVSVLNQLRRQALEDLLTQRQTRAAIPFVRCRLPEPESPQTSKTAAWRAHFSRVDGIQDIPKEALCCEQIYVPLAVKEEVLRSLLEQGMPVGLEIPRGMFGIEGQVREHLERAATLGVRDVWAGTLGAVAVAKGLGLTIHGGFSLNIANRPALQFLSELGLADTELSPELSMRQARSLTGPVRRGVLMYGRLPLMLCRNCPAANAPKGCRDCSVRGGGREPLLTDRKGMQFPVWCSGSCSEVFNAVPLSLSDQQEELRGMDFGVFRFSVENSVEIVEIFQHFQTHTGLPGLYTRPPK